MDNISLKTKSELFSAIIKEKNAFIWEQDKGILTFLDEIWRLESMPSQDIRFTNAFQDIYHHTVNNDDWDYQFLFGERLKLFQEDVKFIKFIETLVNIKYRKNEDDLMKYVLLINSYLEKDSFVLALSKYDENEFPVYLLKKIEGRESFYDLAPNRFNFYVEKSPTGHEDKFTSHSKPENTPSFVLVPNLGWNDFGYVTAFHLFFYKSVDVRESIGYIKITDGTSIHTIDTLETNFLLLSDDFCSLGSNFEYYEKLKVVTGKEFESVLFALKDCAFYSHIHDKFEKNIIFRSSLIRYDNAERQLRQVKHKIYGYDLTNLYSFKYNFKPKYSEEAIEVDFEFGGNDETPNRIFALIGKNGTGKTQLITKIPLDFAAKKTEVFTPRPPLFSKVIAVSYCIFDDFEIPKSTSNFNYIYCGLFEIREGKKQILSPRQQSLRFHITWKRIKELQRMDTWRKTLIKFIDKELIDRFIIFVEGDPKILNVDVNEFNKIKGNLSSGQAILLYILSEIISHIRFDSLILFDEPETHLHPNAVSQLMSIIYDLVDEFESYCIISTHSPLVIQEILSKNVFIVERHGNIPSLRRIGIESFGENLTTLTEEVFGNREIKKHYKKIIEALVNQGLAYNQIISKLESDNIPLSLNARLYLRSLSSE